MFDYKILIPATENNYLNIDGHEIKISFWKKINIEYDEERASYWFEISIPVKELDILTCFKKFKKKKAILLLGDNRYEIHGELDILNQQSIPYKEEIEFTLLYLVKNVKDVLKYPRKELKVTRSELLDFEK